MTQPQSKKAYSLKELAEHAGCLVEGDGSLQISGVATLEEATPGDLSFLGSSLYRKVLAKSEAGAIVVHQKEERPTGRHYLIHDNPSSAFQKILELIKGSECCSEFTSGFADIHSSAVIHTDATIGSNSLIAPKVVIDKGATVGANCTIGPGVYIGANVTIGQDCVVHANVVLQRGTVLGDRVIIQPGAVIGSCGFGYETHKDGTHHKVRSAGNVELEDDVEVGANTTIDRARIGSTLIKKGTKIDNQVQIAHAVTIGEDGLIISQVGIAGSTKLGRSVILAGQVGVAGHLSISDNVIIAAKSGVTKSINKAGIYSGLPAMKKKEHFVLQAHMRNLQSYVPQLKELGKRVAELEQAVGGHD